MPEAASRRVVELAQGIDSHSELNALGRHSRAREECGRIYPDDPGYEDVAEHIGWAQSLIA